MRRTRDTARLARPAGIAAMVSLIAACATARPEQQMTAVAADGRLVPLDSVTTAYDVGGVHVIQRPNYANDAVAVNLYLLGGTRQLTPATQGVELLLLRAAEYGSVAYPGAASREAWAATGSRLITRPEADWTVYGFRAIRQEFDSTWSIFADRVMHPSLATRDVALVRDRLIADARTVEDDPDGYVSRLADSAAFSSHPYGLEADGTVLSLARLDSATLAAYAAREMVTSRMLLVVVGNVSRDRVESAVSRTLARLPRGQYVWSLPPVPTAFHSTALLRPRSVATNYVFGVFQGPPASSPAAPAFRVAMALLSARIHQSVRERHGLSYAAGAPYLDRGINMGGIYVTTTLPGVVLPLIRAEMDSVRHLPYELGNLRYFTDQFIVDYFAENMTDAAQADFLARAQLYRGDFRKASEAMEDLRHVSGSDVRAAADRYFRDIHFVYVGDTSRVKQSDFTRF